MTLTNSCVNPDTPRPGTRYKQSQRAYRRVTVYPSGGGACIDAETGDQLCGGAPGPGAGGWVADGTAGGAGGACRLSNSALTKNASPMTTRNPPTPIAADGFSPANEMSTIRPNPIPI